MSQEVYTFKLNAEKFRNNLPEVFSREAGSARSFDDYILKKINPERAEANRIFKIDSYPSLDPNVIVQNLMDVQERATAADVALVYQWLWDTYSLGYISVEESTEMLSYCGFELIYEFKQRDRCWVYCNQISEYLRMNDLEDEKDNYDGHFNLYNCDLFKRCLDYLLMLLSKISLDKEYKNHDMEYSEEALAPLKDYAGNELLDRQTELALKQIREENEEEDSREKENSNYRRSSTNHHYYVAYSMFFQIQEIQQKIADHNGKIFVFDSY